jgi:hypothetical protein
MGKVSWLSMRAALDSAKGEVIAVIRKVAGRTGKQRH